jgi:hypothetical protein
VTEIEALRALEFVCREMLFGEHPAFPPRWTFGGNISRGYCSGWLQDGSCDCGNGGACPAFMRSRLRWVDDARSEALIEEVRGNG